MEERVCGGGGPFSLVSVEESSSSFYFPYFPKIIIIMEPLEISIGFLHRFLFFFILFFVKYTKGGVSNL